MAIDARFLGMAACAGRRGKPCGPFMLPHKIGPVMVHRAKARKIRMTRFAGVRGLHVIVTRIARCHGRNERPRGHSFLFEICMAGDTIHLLSADMRFVREDQFTFRTCRGGVRALVTAGMTIGAVLCQLLFVATLAVFFLGQEVLGRELARRCRFMTCGALQPRTFHMQGVREPYCFRLLRLVANLSGLRNHREHESKDAGKHYQRIHLFQRQLSDSLEDRHKGLRKYSIVH